MSEKRNDNNPVTEKVCIARMNALNERIIAVEKSLSEKIDSIKWVIITSFSLSTAIISLIIWLLR